jgi:hypothetical protein
VPAVNVGNVAVNDVEEETETLVNETPLMVALV